MGKARAQARELAEQTAAGGPQAEAAWLRVYEEAGIPVLSDGGQPVGDTGDDPLGPDWWTVWMVAGSDPTKGFSLPVALAGSVLVDTPLTPQESDALAVAFLDGLGRAETAENPSVRFTSLFLQEKLRRPGVVDDVLAPGTDLASTRVDLPTTLFLSWMLRRAVAGFIATEGGAGVGSGRGSAATARAPRLAVPVPAADGGGSPCSEFWGTEQSTAVVNFLANKLGGGFAAPVWGAEALGETYGGAVQQIAKKIFGEQTVSALGKAATKVEALGSLLSGANVVSSLLSAAMMYAAMNVDGSLESLERTKDTTDGKEATGRIDIVIDPESMPDGNKKAACAVSQLANAAGVSFSLPPAGPAGGVSVKLEGGRNFRERWIWGDYKLAKPVLTGPEGSVAVKLLGKAQKKRIPDDAQRNELEYSITVTSTIDPVDANSIFTMFFDSLSFTATPNKAAAGAVGLDFLKRNYFELGEQFAPLIDWEQGWRAEGGSGVFQLSGLVCSLTTPFTLEGDGMAWSFTPKDDRSGTWQASGQLPEQMAGGRIEYSGNGTYTVSVDESGGTIDTEGEEFATPPVGGKITFGDGGGRTYVLTPTDECE